MEAIISTMILQDIRQYIVLHMVMDMLMDKRNITIASSRAKTKHSNRVQIVTAQRPVIQT
ncbi:MAG: hypothetical protein WA667_21215 [Candidatus Nitrosopolaris sp.]